ncbi:hypothetical protein [Hydrocarboniphaga effusa]|uniref:hypothetical protein n=1 Tax=Hydrocarboniphaga effusa TaxID=243629 RepID=UPI003138158A
MRKSLVASAVMLSLSAGCASYVTPGGPVKLAEISRVGDDMVSRQPSPKFPASIGVVRVQAPRYASASTRGYGKGVFSLVTAQELIGDPQLAAIGGWASVGKVQTLDTSLLPSRFDSLDDLRLAAAKLQIDVLLVTTVDTVFEAGGKTFGPSSDFKLGKSDTDAAIRSTASAVFVDVRTGFSYGQAEAGARAADLAAAGDSEKSLDRLRLQTERQAFEAFLVEAQTTWAGIERRYN